MLILLLALFGVIVLAASLAYLLGFRVGGQHWQSRLDEVRTESAEASRQMHNLTREAFVAMADYALQRRNGEQSR
jgi:hypothetical protein